MLLYLVLLFVSPMRSVDNPCGTPVQSCPTTEQSWNRRASSFPCSKQHLHYVCIFYKDGQLIEACIINFPVASSAGGCPSVSSCDERGPVLSFYSDYIPCPKESFACPRKGHGGYQITQLYKFRFCVGENGSEIVLSTTPSMFTSTSSISVATIVGIVTSSVVSLVVFVTAISIVYCKRRNRMKTSKEEGDSAEMEPLGITADENDVSYGIPDDVKDFLEENSERNFYKTKAYSRIKSIINDGKSVLVVGDLGSGKTHTCFRLFQDYHERSLRGRKHKCQYLTKLDDLRRRRFNKEEINVLLLDDCFQHWNYIHQSETKYITLINNLYVEHRKTYSVSMVITINSFTWEIHRDRIKELTDFIVLNISSGEYEPTNAEKEQICQEVFQFYGVEIANREEEETFRLFATTSASVTLKVHRNSIKNFAAEINIDTPNIGFPICCALFCRCKKFMLLGKTFFGKPMTNLKEEISRMKESENLDDQKHYLTLVYVMLRGRVDANSTDTDLLEKLYLFFRAKRVAVATSATTDYINAQYAFKRDLGDRNGLLFTGSNFLVKRDDGFVFLHETVHVAVLLDFGRNHTHLFLTHCDGDILLKYVISSKSYSDIPYSEIKLIRLMIQRHHFKRIAKRFPPPMDEKFKVHILYNDEEMREQYQQSIP